MVAVCPCSVSVCVFTDSAGVGVEAAEELAKATGVCVCESVRARPAGECGQSAERHLRGLHGWTDMNDLAEDRGKAGVG